MCGIVGYIGSQDSKEVLLKGLEKLEYRGYDSAGIAVMGENGVQVFKANIMHIRTKVHLDVLPSFIMVLSKTMNCLRTNI